MAKTKTTPTKTTKKKIGRPRKSGAEKRKAIHTYITDAEKAEVCQAMELEGQLEFAVFMRKCLLDRARAIIAARRAGMPVL